MKPHVHAEAIKAWADGAAMEWRQNEGPWHKLDDPVHWPNEGEGFEFRIKPAEPERENFVAFFDINTVVNWYLKFSDRPETESTQDLLDLVNLSFREAIDAGLIVARADFDRAIGDRAARDMAVAKKVLAYVVHQVAIRRPVVGVESVLESVINEIK